MRNHYIMDEESKTTSTVEVQKRTTLRRHWSFRIKNYTNQNVEQLHKVKYRYIIYGTKYNKDTWEKDLHGFIYFKNQKSLTSIEKHLGHHVDVSSRDIKFQKAIEDIKELEEVEECGIRPKTCQERVQTVKLMNNYIKSLGISNHDAWKNIIKKDITLNNKN